jgi:seryl-tRNA synthetase
MRMLNAQETELPKENQDCKLNKLDDLEKLEKEEESLIQEKKDLMEAEEQLWLKISVEIENRRRRNMELKQEVEQLRRKCEELTSVLNRGVISQLSEET